MRRQFILAGVGGVVVLALFFMFVLRPVGAKIAETRDEFERAKSEETNLRLQLRQLQQAQRNDAEVAAQLAKFDLLLPRTSDLPSFIRQVQEAADLSGIELASIAPSPPTPVAAGAGTDPAITGRGVFTLNVVLTISGGFFRMRSFLQRLEGLQRVVQVNNLSITPSVDEETGVTELSSTVALVMYVVNPAAPPTGGGTTPTPTPSPTPSPSPTPTSGGGGTGGPVTPTPSPSP